MLKWARTFTTLSKQRCKLSVPQTRCFSDGPYDVDANTEPRIPEYKVKEGEDTEVKRARLLYQSRKRGMSENGLLLSSFAKVYLPSFDEKQLKDYDQLINQPSNDWEIYYWVTGVKPTPDEFNSDVMNLLKEHAKNKDRNSRIKQPELYS